MPCPILNTSGILGKMRTYKYFSVLLGKPVCSRFCNGRRYGALDPLRKRKFKLFRVCVLSGSLGTLQKAAIEINFSTDLRKSAIITNHINTVKNVISRDLCARQGGSTSLCSSPFEFLLHAESGFKIANRVTCKNFCPWSKKENCSGQTNRSHQCPQNHASQAKTYFSPFKS